jgi:glycosyltransferase involved in cell wall biosynthesis
MKNNFYVIIPACNEEKRILDVINNTKKYAKNIIVVDDGSKDSTYNKARKKGVDVLRHIINLGKGAALKTGCDYAIKQGAKKLIVMDADGQHDPSEIPNFVKNLNNVDIVLGYRKLKNIPLVSKFGNWFISRATKLLYGLDLKDTQGGYRAFKSNVYKKIRWKANDYSIESEMIANIGKYGLRYKEIPIKTIYEDRYKGTTVLDGIKIVFNMILWKLKK